MDDGDQAAKDAALTALTRYSIELCHLKESMPRRRRSGLDFATLPGAQFAVFAQPHNENFECRPQAGDAYSLAEDTFSYAEASFASGEDFVVQRNSISNERRSRRRAVYRREARATAVIAAAGQDSLFRPRSFNAQASSHDSLQVNEAQIDSLHSSVTFTNSINIDGGDAHGHPPCDYSSGTCTKSEDDVPSSENSGMRILKMRNGRDSINSSKFHMPSVCITQSNERRNGLLHPESQALKRNGNHKESSEPHRKRKHTDSSSVKENENRQKLSFHNSARRPDRQDESVRRGALAGVDEQLRNLEKPASPISLQRRGEQMSFAHSCVDESAASMTSMTSIMSLSWTSQEPKSCPVLGMTDNARSDMTINREDAVSQRSHPVSSATAVPSLTKCPDASAVQESWSCKDLSNNNFVSLRSTSLNSRPSFAFPKKEVVESEEQLQGTVRVGQYVKRTRFLRLTRDGLMCHRRKRGTCVWAESVLGASVHAHSKRLRLTLRLANGRTITLHFGTSHATDTWAAAIRRASFKCE